MAMRDFHPMSLAATLAVGAAETAGRWRRVVQDLLRPYRPELHYMRGPGPKWRAKHDGSPAIEARQRRTVLNAE
jgi:hypothetical protein